MGVAAAQLALQNGKYAKEYPSLRVGVSFASGYIVQPPQEVADAMFACREVVDGQPRLRFDKWREFGMSKMTPLWQLKYLTNMAASHITIFNEFFGPAFDVTAREASFGIALAESVDTIKQGAADAMIVGATGSHVHPYRFVDVLKYGELTPEILRSEGATEPGVCRPFDARRVGTIPGEGAGALLIEAEETALKRGAKIYAEAVGGATRSVSRHARNQGKQGCDICSSFESLRESFRLTLRALATKAGFEPEDIGHINAAARGDALLDKAEAAGLRDVLGDALDRIPTTTLAGHIGNTGAGCGALQTIASILALEHEELFLIPTTKRPTPNVASTRFRISARRATLSKVCANLAGQTSAITCADIKEPPLKKKRKAKRSTLNVWLFCRRSFLTR